ncbi:LA_2272 family surface repeat-containing protein [Aquimarina sp. AU119]|uniref:LA_2272 family surface repeat-containing protein n=1 Tax=Aquimarina sp. AU119 TaxID=2108528 RepID=UPI000D696CF6|nr:hypothetical protein [Aquimarina sp. AU119]
MKNRILIIIVLLISISVVGQNRKTYFPAWTFHSSNSDIIGLSLGVVPKDFLNENNTTLTRSYGVRLEAPGLGVFYFMAPSTLISGGADMKSLTDHVYGINISGGSIGDIAVDGISGALMGQYLQRVNGIAFAGIGNSIEEQRGISLSIYGNEMYEGFGISASVLGNQTYYYTGVQIGAINDIEVKGVGLQIGLFNKSTNHRGIQIGLWNKNEKRSLPFINWQFSKKKTKIKES